MSTVNPAIGTEAGHGHAEEHGHGDGHGHVHHGSFISTYVFSTDHKMIGKQFLITTLLCLMVGGALALGVRWQLAFRWEAMRSSVSSSRPRRPDFARVLHDARTMHASS